MVLKADDSDEIDSADGGRWPPIILVVPVPVATIPVDFMSMVPKPVVPSVVEPIPVVPVSVVPIPVVPLVEEPLPVVVERVDAVLESDGDSAIMKIMRRKEEEKLKREEAIEEIIRVEDEGMAVIEKAIVTESLTDVKIEVEGLIDRGRWPPIIPVAPIPVTLMSVVPIPVVPTPVAPTPVVPIAVVPIAVVVETVEVPEEGVLIPRMSDKMMKRQKILDKISQKKIDLMKNEPVGGI
jgi:hypothetical protein